MLGGLIASSSSWDFKDIPDLSGKVAIVTGANSGIGLVTARELARKGAHVILACRTESKALPVVESLKAETGNPNIEFLRLDLASLQSVQDASAAFLARGLPLHLLVNNAGIMAPPKFETSKDGIEMQMASNHFGHFLLTRNLLPVLESSRPSRIVNVSSVAHTGLFAPSVGIRFDKYNSPAHYGPYTNYGESKLANILFTRALQSSLDARGIHNVYVNTLHPGVIASNLGNNAAGVGERIMGMFSWALLSTEQGAKTQLYLATSPDVETQGIKGQYYLPIAKRAETDANGRNAGLAQRWWDHSNQVLADKGFAGSWPSTRV